MAEFDEDTAFREYVLATLERQNACLTALAAAISEMNEKIQADRRHGRLADHADQDPRPIATESLQPRRTLS